MNELIINLFWFFAGGIMFYIILEIVRQLNKEDVPNHPIDLDNMSKEEMRRRLAWLIYQKKT